MKHPIQPLRKDSDGIVRFKENKIVCLLLDTHPELNLNKLSVMNQQGNFNKGDYTQLMQLIGYSASGYGELSTSPKKIVKMADKLAVKMLNKRR